MKDISAMPRSYSNGKHAGSALAATASRDGHELAEILAHEFSNLLMPIMGYAEMAADALRPGSSSRLYVERIRDAGDRARRAVEQILDSGKRREQSDCFFDIAAATEEILPDVRMCLPSSSQLQVNLPDHPVWLEGSAINVQQIIINLCKNAGEAMKTGGTVTVNVDHFEQTNRRSVSHGRLERGQYVRLSVSDTGSGIPHKLLDHVFDPFFTTKSDQGGTGLGLAVVLRVVKSWNGAINIESFPGMGTTLELFLPCKSSAAGANEHSAANAVNHRSTQRTRRRRAFRSHAQRRMRAQRRARSRG